MYRLVAYETTVSSIIEAGLERTEDTIYTHKFVDSVEPLIKTGLIHSVLIVSKNRDPVIEKLLERYNINYGYKKVETKWYESFVSRHLIEPRIREFDREKMRSEYPYVLHREYRTLEILHRLVHNNIPRKAGDFIYLYTKHRVPTIDFAVLLHLKYGGHVCVTSKRDTGLAFACVTSPETGAILYRILRRETGIVKFTMENIITGFIPSFPESPHVLHQDIIRMLSEIDVRGRVSLPQSVIRRFPFLEALLDNLSFEKFGRIKVRINKERIPYIENGSYEYILFHKLLTPLYSYKNGDGDSFVIYRVYLPLTRKIAVYTRSKKPKIVVANRLVKPEATEETIDGYIQYLPKWVTAKINNYVRDMKTGLLAVFNRV